jgi:hypothetical protein
LIEVGFGVNAQLQRTAHTLSIARQHLSHMTLKGVANSLVRVGTMSLRMRVDLRPFDSYP